MERDGKATFWVINPMVGVCSMTVRTEGLMRDSESEEGMCVMEEVTILIFKKWRMREVFVKENDGDEAFNMIELETLCLMENG